MRLRFAISLEMLLVRLLLSHMNSNERKDPLKSAVSIYRRCKTVRTYLGSFVSSSTYQSQTSKSAFRSHHLASKLDKFYCRGCPQLSLSCLARLHDDSNDNRLTRDSFSSERSFMMLRFERRVVDLSVLFRFGWIVLFSWRRRSVLSSPYSDEKQYWRGINPFSANL